MLLGIDFGSGGVKLTVMAKDGAVRGESSSEYPTIYPALGYAEQDPAVWWSTLRRAVKDAVDSGALIPSELEAISVDSATHTAVLLDKDCRPLQNAIFWTDLRCSAEAAELAAEHFDTIWRKSLHKPSTIWTLPQLLWVWRNQPDIHAKIAHVLFEKDYVRYLMTGKLATDYIEAVGSMLYDTTRGVWDEELCSLCGLDTSVMPPIFRPLDMAGRLTPSAAADLGLAAGTPVLTGTTDTALEVFGAGAIAPGDATVKLATAGRICVVTEGPHPNPYLVCYPHVVEGLWYPGTATRSAASAFRWYRDTIGCEKYKILDEGAAEITPGCEGLFFNPYLMGELSPYNDDTLRASFVGATMKHTKAHFTRAVLEGVAFSLRDGLDVLTGEGIDLTRAAIIGGGASSPLWRQITADILGIPLTVPERSDSSYASAMLAGIGAGVFSSHADAAAKCVRIVAEVTPNPERHEVYEKHFAVYRQIHDALKPVYKCISEL